MLVFFSLFIAAAIIVIDQLLKVVVIQNVKPATDGIQVIEGLLEWRYSENTGAAFSMLSDQRWIFIVTSIVLLALCMYILLFKCQKSPYGCLTLGIILGGGMANMIDRIAVGYVVDYIHVSFFPAIFNFADCCVCIGASLLAIGILYEAAKDTKKAKAAKAAKAAEAAGEAEPPAESDPQ